MSIMSREVKRQQVVVKESKKKDRGRLGTARRKFAQKARANFGNRRLPRMLPQVRF